MEDVNKEASSIGQGGFRFEDPRQGEIYALLRRLVGNGPASFYRDACRHMTAEPPMEAVTHQVGHLVREIDTALLGILGSVTSGGEPEEDDPLEDENRRGAIEAAMEAFGVPEEIRTHKTQRLVNELTQESRSRKISSVLDALGLPKNDRMARSWKSPPRSAHSWAHRNQLLPPRPLNVEFRQFWEQTQNVWLAVLKRFETKFTDSFPLMDRLLAKDQPGKRDVAKLQEGVPDTAVTYEYFFSKMTDARWIEPLSKALLRPSA